MMTCKCEMVDLLSEVPEERRGFSVGKYAITKFEQTRRSYLYPTYKSVSDTDTIVNSGRGYRRYKYKPHNPDRGNPEIKFRGCIGRCLTECKNKN